MNLKVWQWLILSFPIVSVVSFFIIAGGIQIHQWGINWLWGVFIITLVGWRWLLVRWTKPLFPDIQEVITAVENDLQSSSLGKEDNQEILRQLENTLENIIVKTREDAPFWEDLQLFANRCQELVREIAMIYYPDEKYPLLTIRIPQAYGLIRGTVDDMDKWMKQLSPALNQVTLAQGYEGYQLYRRFEPSARKLWQLWSWAQWVINPTVAMAKLASENTNKQANQELLINLSQVIREVALRNLTRQAVLLYGKKDLSLNVLDSKSNILPVTKTQTLRDILTSAQCPEQMEQKPVNILMVGRTGAGKSSLINTLFNSQTAEVDVLPSTTEIKSYQWQKSTEEKLVLWDTPGYEQINQADYLTKVLDYADKSDIIVMVNPALDPALEMDRQFLLQLRENDIEVPLFLVVTQIDRLRPLREWQPPYDWQNGQKPKEISIRRALSYRQETLGEYCRQVLPIVTADYSNNPRGAWYDDILAMELLEAVTPAKQMRLARFFRNVDAKTVAAAKMIDKYSFQMATTQGLTNLLKSPVLQFISTLTTGSPRLAYLLAEKIPVEQLPVVIGKLQLAYDLFSLFDDDNIQFDLLSLWTLLIDSQADPEKEAWALGHALIEYWCQNLSFSQLQSRYDFYLEGAKLI